MQLPVFALLTPVVRAHSKTHQEIVLVSICNNHVAITIKLLLLLYIACAAGCRACTGPNNSDCQACEDETLYRVTTDQSSSSACITAAECATPVVNAFGDRTCDMIMISPTNIMISPTSIMISPTSKMISPTSTVISPTSKMIVPTNQGVSLSYKPRISTLILSMIFLLQGGASSIHYHQFLLLFLLVVYSLYL